jgi:hypothetical protein
MKSAETLLACCVMGLACFVGGQAVGVKRASVHAEADGTIAKAASRGAPVRAATLRRAELGAVPAVTSRAERPASSPEELRRRIAVGMTGTYISEMLVARDSAISRWPERTTRPLRVYIADGAPHELWNPAFIPSVREAFDTWTKSGIPVRFTFVTDADNADVTVSFLEKFASGISGKTVWSRDDNHWLLSSDIQLAVTHPNGGSITPAQMRAIALHEVGHLLGLDHTSDTGNIMAPRVRVRELSEADRATARLVYTVPAGSLKQHR